MRFVVALAILLASSVLAQDSFLKGDALQAEIAKSCADGCVTFNREEAEAFQEAMDKIIQKALAQKEQEGFERGRQDARQRCPSLI
jgi:hypothetical protein